jgi:hypothetical protein
MLHTHLVPLYEVCDNSDQAGYNHTLDSQFGVSTLTWHFVSLGVKIIQFLVPEMKLADGQTAGFDLCTCVHFVHFVKRTHYSGLCHTISDSRCG